jgi:hypothetical protein
MEPRQRTGTSARWAAWQHWLAAAGGWRGWVTCPALMAPDIDGAAVTGAAAAPLADAGAIAAELTASLETAAATAVVLDLEPVLGVHVASYLSRQGLASAVLVLPRWPYAEAILPVGGLIAALIEAAPYQRQREPGSHVVFVLDAERRRSVPSRPAHDGRADNRYNLSATDLPTLSSLQKAGIRRVVKVYRGAGEELRPHN